MSDVMPPEDELTKTQLWQRIDITRATIESHRQELDTRMDSLNAEILRSMRSVLEEDAAKRKLDNVEIANLLTGKIKESEDEIIALSKSLNDRAVEARAELERKLKDFMASVPAIVKKEASGLNVDIQIKVNDLEALVAKFQKEISAQIANSQVEMRSKVGMVDAKLESVLNALRSVLKSL